MTTYRYPTTFKVEAIAGEVTATSHREAVLQVLRDLSRPGTPVAFQVRECGGGGGAKATVVILDMAMEMDGDDGQG